MFACLFCDGNLTRLLIVRRAYILAALIATAAGYLGFFHLIPHYQIFLDNDRVSATFKDPNVYGPFLIYPLLLLDYRPHDQRRPESGRPHRAGCAPGRAVLELFPRRLDAFRRVGRCCGGPVSSPSHPIRACATALSFSQHGAALAAVLLVVALTSIESVRDMLLERAKAIQPYDVGPGGRFWFQQLGDRARFSIIPTASDRSNSAASSAGSSTTSTCRDFWSMAGSAAPPISRSSWSR